MYGYYIIIKGLDALTSLERNTLSELLEGVMVKPTIKIKDDVLIATDVVEAEMSWESFIFAVNGDFYSDLKLYESVMFHSKVALKESVSKNIKKELFKETYNSDKTLFYYETRKHVDENLKRKYLKVYIMIKSF